MIRSFGRSLAGVKLFVLLTQHAFVGPRVPHPLLSPELELAVAFGRNLLALRDVPAPAADQFARVGRIRRLVALAARSARHEFGHIALAEVRRRHVIHELIVLRLARLAAASRQRSGRLARRRHHKQTRRRVESAAHPAVRVQRRAHQRCVGRSRDGDSATEWRALLSTASTGCRLRREAALLLLLLLL